MTRSSLVFLALASMFAVARPAGAPSPPRFVFSAKNNTQATLTCREKFPREDWSAPNTIPPGDEVTRASGSEKTLMLNCDAPVERVVYALQGGKRYSFLRLGNGATIALRFVE